MFCPTDKLSQELQQEGEQVNTPSDLREVLSSFLDYITLVPKGEDGLRQSDSSEGQAASTRWSQNCRGQFILVLITAQRKVLETLWRF